MNILRAGDKSPVQGVFLIIFRNFVIIFSLMLSHDDM